MDIKAYLIMAKNTAQMLLIDKTLRQFKVKTDMVPAPPETGTVCAIAIKVSGSDLGVAEIILNENNIEVASILEDKKLKLQGLFDKKLGNAVSQEFIEILKKIEEGDDLEKNEIVYLLSTDNDNEIKTIFAAADKVRKEMVGDVVEIRGAIEFSNYCQKRCKYCGINANVKNVNRYCMSEDEILNTVFEMKEMGLKTVILQSGEDTYWTSDRIVSLVKRVKKTTGMKITLSVGERTKEEYEAFKDAGADNYLLKIETTNKKLFEEIHPDDNYEQRLTCARWLKELGYINGSGNIIGLPGQTKEDIANDIVYFKEMGINMIGLGPFIPAKGSEYENVPFGDINLTLRTVAVTRIVCKKVYIPSTTALASLDKDAQVRALECGANSIMLINTPAKYRDSYRPYDNKNMVDMDATVYAIKKAGREFPKYIKLNDE